MTTPSFCSTKTEHGTSPRRSWWSPGYRKTATGRSWERKSCIVRMRNSGRDCSRTAKNEVSPGSAWSSPMGTPASRKQLRLPSSAYPGRHTESVLRLPESRSLPYVPSPLTWAVLRNSPWKHQKEVAEGLKEAYGREQNN